MTRHRWVGVMAGALLAVGGCAFPGGEEPEVLFLAASVTPGECSTEDVRLVTFFADVSPDEVVDEVAFRFPGGELIGLTEDANGDVDETSPWPEGEVIEGQFVAFRDGTTEYVATSDSIGPITVADCD